MVVMLPGFRGVVLMIGIQCETIDEDNEEDVPNEFREAFEEIVTSELVEVEASELFESDKESI